MSGLDYLGKGAKFPFQANKATGRVAISEGYQNVKESVYLILMTAKSERFLRKDFGSRLLSYTFMDINTTQLTLMSHDITECLTEQEPRITDVLVGIDPDVRRGCLIVNVDYTIIADNVRDNLVFPFYLNVVQEEDSGYEAETESI